MAKIYYDLTLNVADLNDGIYVRVKESDENSRAARVTLEQNGSALTVPQDALVTINVRRADGTAKAFVGAVSDQGKIVVPIPNWCMAQAGVASADISVIVGDEKLTSFSFSIGVQQASVSNQDIENDENYDALVELINDVKGSVVTSRTVYYLATSQDSGVTPETPGWTTTPQTITNTNRFLWIYSVLIFEDETEIVLPPCVCGVFGDKGDKGDKGDTGAQGERGEKGEKGDTGATGAAAGFGAVTATAEMGEEAGASVVTSGPDTAKDFVFSFILPPVANLSITALKLANNAVITQKIADVAVSTSKLKDGCVTSAKIADGAVTPVKLSTYGGLPSNCTPLRFLATTSDATQYINTGIAPVFEYENGTITKATGYYIEAIQPVFYSNVGTRYYNFWFGSADSASQSTGDNVNGLNVFLASNGSIRTRYLTDRRIYGAGTYRAILNCSVASATTVGFTYKSDFDGTESINSVALSTPMSQNAPILLFALGLSAEWDNINKVYTTVTNIAKELRVKAFKIVEYSADAEGGYTQTLVRDFAPVLDPWDRPSMYDKVSQTYFYNDGTGEFLYA